MSKKFWSGIKPLKQTSPCAKRNSENGWKVPSSETAKKGATDRGFSMMEKYPQPPRPIPFPLQKKHENCIDLFLEKKGHLS